MNPYEAPRSELAPPPPLLAMGAQPMYWAEGNLLVCRSGAVLPPVCLKTCQAISEETDPRSRQRKFHYFVPTWFLLFTVVFAIGVVLAYFIFRKGCLLEYTLSEGIRRKYFRRGVGSVLLLLTGIGTLAGLWMRNGIAPFTEAILFASGVALLGAALIASLFRSPVNVVKHRKGLFYLKGVSPAFLDAVRERVA